MNELINFYDIAPKQTSAFNPNAADGAPIHPFPVALIVGCTGSGKTSSLLNIIFKCEAFDRIHICTKIPDETLYAFLKNRLDKIDTKLCTFYPEIEDLPKLTELNTKHQHLFVIDDMVPEMTNKIRAKIVEDIAIRCRKSNTSLVFISQTYFGIPRPVRLQASYLILKQINSKRDIKSIISDAGLPFNPDRLMKVFKETTDGLGHFLMIDLKTCDNRKRLRKNFEPDENLFERAH